MKSTGRVSPGRLKPFCFGTALMLAMLMLVAVSTTAARAQSVFVPGNASGCFGYPAPECVSLVTAITVTGPATITVTYVSGTVDTGYCNPTCLGPVGPNGARVDTYGKEYPLQEAQGISGGWINNIGALIGVFVPEARVQRKGFTAIDGTKDATRVGIKPGWLFIGEGKTAPVSEAGTLFLGVNDWDVTDNSGGFNVTVTGP